MKPAGMPGMSHAASLSLTSCSGALPSFIAAARAMSIASGGLKAFRDLNIRPNRASLSRPDRTAMSLPRGLPTACDPRAARGREGLGGLLDVAEARAGAAMAVPVPSRGAIANDVRPMSIARRENRPPVGASGAPAPLNGQTPLDPAVFPVMRAVPVAGDQRQLPPESRLPAIKIAGYLRARGSPAPQNWGAGTGVSRWVVVQSPAAPFRWEAAHHAYCIGAGFFPGNSWSSRSSCACSNVRPVAAS